MASKAIALVRLDRDSGFQETGNYKEATAI